MDNLILLLLAIIGWVLYFFEHFSNHAWDIDSTIWFKVRDKILKDKYAGCVYSILTSNSPVIIRHREILPYKERIKIRNCFPKGIRVEFQQIHYEGVRTSIYGRGDLLMYDSNKPNAELEGLGSPLSDKENVIHEEDTK